MYIYVFFFVVGAPTLLFVDSYTPKLHKEDEVRVRLAVAHYEAHIDFDTLLRST